MSEELRRCRRFRRSDAAFALLLLLALWPGMAAGQETIRIGLPTKTFWPTVVTEAAIRQKVFANEGIKVEPTIYRGGAECFEALAAGAADLILDPPALVATGRKKGVMSKLVAAGGMEASGWFLMVRADSKSTTPAELSGKKVGITSPDPVPTCSLNGPCRTRRSRSRECRSVVADWFQTFWRGTSMQLFSIRH